MQLHKSRCSFPNALQVQKVRPKDGDARFPSVQSHDDQQHLYAENLAPDIAAWRHKNLSAAVMVEWFKQQPLRSTRKVMMIRNGTVSFPLQPPGVQHICRDCNVLLGALLEALQRWTRRIPFPDVVWFMNVDDVSMCRWALRQLHVA